VFVFETRVVGSMSEVRRAAKGVEIPMMVTTDVRPADELVEKEAGAALSYSAYEPARPAISWRSAALRFLFPRDDREQEVRFRRYLIAAATSLLVLALLGVCCLAGALAPRPFAVTAAIVLLSIAAFYLVIRSGLNRYAADPSLTVPMMVAAIGAVTYALYHLGDLRTVFRLVYPVIMFFGVLRLGTRPLLLVAAFIITAYLLVVVALANEPGHIDSIQVEALRTMTLAAVLVWFAFMGGYVHDLRRRLRESGYDRLTGVHNRGRILDVLTREQLRFERSGGSLCVCLVDADELKGINDTLGHRAGDVTLQTIARVANRELRVVDAIGRYGGDEFLLVLSQTGVEGARECAERIRARIALSDCVPGDAPRRITVSCGITRHRRGEPLQETLQRADAALYRAKHRGRNCVEVA
jgi:diguanylate cyclase (GGDEF)-like protein